MTGRLPLALALCAIAAVPLLVACSGDDDDSPESTSTATVATGSVVVQAVDRAESPTLTSPASKYGILLSDLPANAYLTDIPHTYTFSTACEPDQAACADYADSPAFDSAQKGSELLASWGYEGGYETAIIPEGREAATLNGAYFIVVETHLFDSAEGAQAAYGYLQSRISQNNISKDEAAPPVGNESAAWSTADGFYKNTNVVRIHHQVLFRRGNLVAAVKTIGAEPFMKVATVSGLASIVDGKALGSVEAVEPTPTGNYTPAAVSSGSPSRTVTPPPSTTPSPVATR